MADVIRFTHPDTDEEIVIPSKFEVCDNCRGSGKTVDPAIDGNGLSREQFDEDPDFGEEYFSGAYDVVCRECHGKRVILEPDWDRMTPELREVYGNYVHEEAMARRSDRLERDAERRMGA